MKWLGDIADAAGRKVSRLEYITSYLVAYGPAGMFTLAFLDSAFVPLPGANDAVMILLTMERPGWMLLYATAATLGSTLGCLTLYFVSRRLGHAALKRFASEKQARVRVALERYDALSVLVASLLPPPFPFKLFVVVAGVLRFNVLRFTLAILAGRFFRFLLVGFLTLRYGEQALHILKRYAPAIGIGLAVLIISIFIGRSIFQKKRKAVEAVSE